MREYSLAYIVYKSSTLSLLRARTSWQWTRWNFAESLDLMRPGFIADDRGHAQGAVRAKVIGEDVVCLPIRN